MTASSVNTAPIYWDGESTLFTTDAQGRIHILQESGSPVEIAERKWQEANEALQGGK